MLIRWKIRIFCDCLTRRICIWMSVVRCACDDTVGANKQISIKFSFFSHFSYARRQCIVKRFQFYWTYLVDGTPYLGTKCAFTNKRSHPHTNRLQTHNLVHRFCTHTQRKFHFLSFVFGCDREKRTRMSRTASAPDRICHWKLRFDGNSDRTRARKIEQLFQFLIHFGRSTYAHRSLACDCTFTYFILFVIVIPHASEHSHTRVYFYKFKSM